MQIESYLGGGDKMSALLQLKQHLSLEIYRLCILCELDPDTFEIDSFLESIKNEIIIPASNISNLVMHANKLKLVEKKIGEINDQQ